MGRMSKGAWILILIFGGCASPEAAFVGRYTGVASCTAVYDDGERVDSDPVTQTIDIELAADGSAYIAGACTFPLDVVSTQRANLLPGTSCPTAAGTSVVLDGVLSLNEPVLAYSITGRFTHNADPFYDNTNTCTFDGARVE